MAVSLSTATAAPMSSLSTTPRRSSRSTAARGATPSRSARCLAPTPATPPTSTALLVATALAMCALVMRSTPPASLAVTSVMATRRRWLCTAVKAPTRSSSTPIKRCCAWRVKTATTISWCEPLSPTKICCSMPVPAMTLSSTTSMPRSVLTVAPVLTLFR